MRLEVGTLPSAGLAPVAGVSMALYSAAPSKRCWLLISSPFTLAAGAVPLSQAVAPSTRIERVAAARAPRTGIENRVTSGAG